MISFIVIGKNEGLRLKKCFESIHKAIDYDSIKNYEIIYVDSKSIDNSLALAKTFSDIKVFLITGENNAAIARNIGQKNPMEIFYFL